MKRILNRFRGAPSHQPLPVERACLHLAPSEAEAGAVEEKPEKSRPEGSVSAEDEEWDWVQRHTVEAAQIIRDFLGGDALSLEGKSVMDLGCGDGLIDWGIATSLRPHRLVGVDLELTDSDRLLRRLQVHGLAAEGLPACLSFATCSPDKLPFEDDAFDWALSWSSFEHIHDPLASIREVRRVLKPGGCFFIQVYPFFWSEHGSHLENWYPHGFAQRFALEEIMTRVSPSFARDRTLKVGQVQHARDGNRQPGDQVIWEYLNLNRISLDDLHRALLCGGFWVSKVQLISPVVHLPMELNMRSLTEQLVAGVYLTAVPSPIHITSPPGDDTSLAARMKGR
jgi:ubiquinone/menaquinone biosynthesis C-methylase UbiE